jgi:type II secretory pathway pseudopilin PulG
MTDRQAGFSLLETLVATSIVLLLTGSLLIIAGPTQTGFRTQPAANDVQGRVRAAVQSLEQDLLEAGSGPAMPLAGLPLGALVPGVLPYRVGARRADPPGTYREDTVTVLASQPNTAATTIATGFVGSGGTVTVSLGPGCPLNHPSWGLEAGMSVLLLDASGQWDLYGVSSAVNETVGLEARGAVTGRPYAANAWVIPVAIATYYLRPATAGEGPQLARYDGNQSDLPLVDHVVGLAFEYYGDPQPPRLRAQPGVLGDTTTYGPAPPPTGEDDGRDTWGAGENCVIAAAGAGGVPRLLEYGPAASSLQLLGREALTDGPWCPDAAATNRFDADLLRIRKVRVVLRVEAWADSLRGQERRLFWRPGTSQGGGRAVPDQQVSFEVVLRAPGGSR